MMIGKTIFYNEDLKELGMGGIGLVYEVRDIKLDPDVSLKSQPHGLTLDPPARERSIHESVTASFLGCNWRCHPEEHTAILKHPFLVVRRVFEFSLTAKGTVHPFP